MGRGSYIVSLRLLALRSGGFCSDWLAVAAVLIGCWVPHGRSSDWLWPISGRSNGLRVLADPQPGLASIMSISEIIIITNTGCIASTARVYRRIYRTYWGLGIATTMWRCSSGEPGCSGLPGGWTYISTCCTGEVRQGEGRAKERPRRDEGEAVEEDDLVSVRSHSVPFPPHLLERGLNFGFIPPCMCLVVLCYVRVARAPLGGGQMSSNSLRQSRAARRTMP